MFNKITKKIFDKTKYKYVILKGVEVFFFWKSNMLKHIFLSLICGISLVMIRESFANEINQPPETQNQTYLYTHIKTTNTHQL